MQYFILEFCFTYYTVIYVCILYLFLFKHKLHFVILYSIMITILLDFIEFH